MSSLVLSGNKLALHASLQLSRSLLLNKSIKLLDLSRNLLGPKGCSLLCEGLKENSSILSIDLSHNSIGNEGSKALAALLCVSDNVLRELRVQGNSIGEIGLCAIFRALSLT